MSQSDPYRARLEQQDGTQIYLVGGAVRDTLLKLQVKDRDWVVVGATSKQMTQAGFKPVGKDFPVFLHPRTSEEYALARTERKTGFGYGGFEFSTTASISLEQDLIRRDFRMNAIAQHPDGQLIDPLNGQKDIVEKQIHHISDAFAEDPLRVLRAARFAAALADQGFGIAKPTLRLMRQMTNTGELDHLTPERVWLETQKALNTRAPQIYFQILRQIGALDLLLPELDQLFTNPQPNNQQPHTNLGIQSLMCLATTSRLWEAPLVRLAALTHLIPDLSALRNLYQRLKTPSAYQHLAIQVQKHFNTYLGLDHPDPEQLLKLLEQLGALRDPRHLSLFNRTCTACFLGKAGVEQATPDRLTYQQLLEQALEICVKVDSKHFLAQGFSGKMLGEAIRSHRLKLVQALVKERIEQDVPNQPNPHQ